LPPTSCDALKAQPTQGASAIVAAKAIVRQSVAAANDVWGLKPDTLRRGFFRSLDVAFAESLQWIAG